MRLSLMLLLLPLCRCEEEHLQDIDHVVIRQQVQPLDIVEIKQVHSQQNYEENSDQLEPQVDPESQPQSHLERQPQSHLERQLQVDPQRQPQVDSQHQPERKLDVELRRQRPNQQQRQSTNKGNVVVLLADDLGMETELTGQSACKTPHLMSLARRGVVYDRAWTVVSSCSPSRASILTGLPPHQNGMYGLHQKYHNFQAFTTIKSLPNLLSDNQIRTGIIGKKHVGPAEVYKFDYEATEENHSIMQVGRNITLIREKVRDFLEVNDSRPFLLYLGFHDPHRCGHTHPEFGQFCEKFGNGEDGMGDIPDWTPVKYEPDQVHVPYFVQDTPVAREDIAAQYMTISRLDQGVGVVLQELERAGALEESLIIFTSDNGSPYPNGRTNTYEPGLQVPLIVSSPNDQNSWNTRTSELTSLLDIVPTVLKWFDISYPSYSIFNKQKPVVLTGRSLLKDDLNTTDYTHKFIYASHTLHEVTMYYPMRAIRNQRFKLIQNLAYRMPFPIDQDFFISPVFQDILNRTLEGDLPWYKTLDDYYYRPRFELFDLKIDFTEKNNMAGNPHYKMIFHNLYSHLNMWQNVTQDPWICSPGGVLQDAGQFKYHPQCFTLDNGL